MNFRFESLSRAGVISHGITHAPSLATAKAKLKDQGVDILSITPTFSIKWKGRGLNNRQLSDFFSDIGVLVNSGMTLPDSLETLAATTTDTTLIKLIQRTINNISKGYSFSVAIQDTGVFPEMAVSTVIVGERSGGLGETMVTLGKYYEERDNFSSGIRRSMAYPVVVLAVLFAFLYVAGFWVLPQLSSFMASIKNVPLSTKILMKTTTILREHWYITLFVTCLLPVAAVILFQVLKDSQISRWIYERTKLGRLFKEFVYSTLFLNLSVLHDSGMALTKAITLVADSMSHYIAESLGNTREYLERGLALSEALAKQKVFPPFIVQSVKKGETAGELGLYLKQISEFYLRKTKKNMEILSQVIQPVMLVCIGLIVAGLAAAVFLPVYRNLATLGAGKVF